VEKANTEFVLEPGLGARLGRAGAMSCRVAALLPSTTEIVGAGGAEGDLVGISHEWESIGNISPLRHRQRKRAAPFGAARESPVSGHR
jgi:hypothetical protein